jgi:Kef-type K+ transport system membrane component KefB
MGVSSTVSLPLAMLIVFGTAKLMAELFERCKLPAIVGEILAGLLVGPSILGWIAPNDLLRSLADLGVMFLLFQVGLEVKHSELWAVGRKAALVATLGVIAPFIAGWAILSLRGASNVEAIFVGAAMVATSVGVTAQALSARGLLHERASQIILAAAVIDDVLGLIVLAVVSAVAKGRIDLREILATAALAIGFTWLIARWGAGAMRKASPFLQSKLRVGEVEFNLAIVLLFSLSVLAMRSGVAPIVGAFLAGLAVGDSVSPKVRDYGKGVSELLTPFFLAGIGLRLDLAVFRDSATLKLTAWIVIAAVVTKLIGCGLAVVGDGWSEVMKVGFGMVPRGEVGMVVAQIGLSIGVISSPVYGAVVFMAIATTIITPLLLRFAFPKSQRAVASDPQPEYCPDFISETSAWDALPPSSS